jgi:hypothetical protein
MPPGEASKSNLFPFLWEIGRDRFTPHCAAHHTFRKSQDNCRLSRTGPQGPRFRAFQRRLLSPGCPETLAGFFRPRI